MEQHKDALRLRELANRWMEIASLSIMSERKKMWTSVKDLKAEQPMILVDTGEIIDFISEEELKCVDPFLKRVERYLLQNILQYEEIGDDIVLEPYFQIGWELNFSSFGVETEKQTAKDMEGREIGFKINHPIHSIEDIGQLTERSVSVDREKTCYYKSILEDIFGDILPVKLGNTMLFEPEHSFSPYLGVNFMFVTNEVFNLIGNENLFTWPIDYPDELKKLCEYLTDDKINLYRYIEKEGLVTHNTDNHWAGPGSYGYCSDLPNADFEKPAKLADCWCRTEAQESEGMSPKMFRDFYLPYISKGCELFGLVYYGCCERIDDRWEYIKDAIRNIRAVCVSPWNDHSKMTDYLAKDYVYSGKLNTVHLTQPTVDWGAIEKDLLRLQQPAKNCNFELLFREISVIYNDRKRLGDCVKLAKKICGR